MTNYWWISSKFKANPSLNSKRMKARQVENWPPVLQVNCTGVFKNWIFPAMLIDTTARIQVAALPTFMIQRYTIWYMGRKIWIYKRLNCLWFLSQTSVRHIVVIFFMVVVFNCPFVWICWILTLGWIQDKWMNKKQIGSMCRNTCHSDFEASLGDTLVGMELDCHCLLLWSQLEIFRNGAATQPDLKKFVVYTSEFSHKFSLTLVYFARLPTKR